MACFPQWNWSEVNVIVEPNGLNKNLEKERKRDRENLSDRTGARLVYFAAERTLLSWMRAALGLMIFGFVVHYRREASTDPGRGLSLAVGFTFLVTVVVSGVVVYLVAITG